MGLGDLLIQNRHFRPDELSLFLSDLFLDQRGGQLYGVIQDIKGHAMPVPFGFGKDTVFPLAFCLDAHPMLRQTAEHIFALANVDKMIVNADFVNARVFKLLCQPSAFQHGINAVFISDCD